MLQSTDPAVVDGFLTDASNVRGSADAVFRVTTTEEVAAVVRRAQAEGVPLTVSGARTSTTAASVPEGGWVLSMSGMNAIHAIDSDRATADAGVLLGAFQDETERRGRLYPPDPTSRHDCTLGASIACNASGARSFRYGATRRWVEALEVVLPTGDIRQIRRGDPIPADWPRPTWREPALKSAAGYAAHGDWVDLLVGQEGTLGVITRATVRLTDLPSGVLGFVAWFPDRAAAVDAMRALRAAARATPHGPLSPRCIEYFDRACVALARARWGEAPDAGAALFCEQEIEPAVGEANHLDAWLDALATAGAWVDDTVVTTDDAGRARLHAFRHAVPAGINEQVARRGMPKVGTDLAVPDDGLDAMMARYESAPVTSVLFGHLGDNHLHLNLLPTNQEELQRAKSWYDELAHAAIALGGTVSGEHGIGKLKRHQFAAMAGPAALAEMRALKRHVDPAWILGRGNLFDR